MRDAFMTRIALPHYIAKPPDFDGNDYNTFK